LRHLLQCKNYFRHIKIQTWYTHNDDMCWYSYHVIPWSSPALHKCLIIMALPRIQAASQVQNFNVRKCIIWGRRQERARVFLTVGWSGSRVEFSLGLQIVVYYIAHYGHNMRRMSVVFGYEDDK
jgi:hypothetical protein